MHPKRLILTIAAVLAACDTTTIPAPPAVAEVERDPVVLKTDQDQVTALKDLFDRAWDSPAEAARAIDAVLGRTGMPFRITIFTSHPGNVPIIHSVNVTNLREASAEPPAMTVAADAHPPKCSLYVQGATGEEVAEFTACHAEARGDEDCDDSVAYQWELGDDGLYYLEAVHIHCDHE
jgi:hypothetical protein